MSALKIIIMGSGGVGKSAITCRFTKGEWVAKYDPTIEDQYTKAFEVDGKQYQLEILDTAGQEEFSPLRETFMHTGDGFMLVYSVTDDQTFEDLQSIQEQILRVHPNPNVPMLVVGNKLDLAAEERAVTPEEARTLATKFKGDFIETSAKDDTNIQESFCTLIRNVEKLNRKDSPSPEKVDSLQEPVEVEGVALQDQSGYMNNSGTSTGYLDSRTNSQQQLKREKKKGKKCVIM